MVISVVTVPVAVEALQIEVVALHRLLAILDDLYRPFVERDRSQAGQRSQALLAAGIAGVYLHGIDVHGYAAETTYRVHNEEGIVSMSNAFQLFQRLEQPGGGFCNRRCKDLRAWMIFEGLFEKIAQHRLCAREARAGNTEGHLVLRLEHPAQEFSSFPQYVEELRVEVTKLWR